MKTPIEPSADLIGPWRVRGNLQDTLGSPVKLSLLQRPSRPEHLLPLPQDDASFHTRNYRSPGSFSDSRALRMDENDLENFCLSSQDTSAHSR